MRVDLNTETIKRWRSAFASGPPSAGITVEKARDLAQVIWRRLLGDGGVDVLLDLGRDLPDVLYALEQHSDRSSEGSSASVRLSALKQVHECVELRAGLFLDSEEHRVLTARFAYRAWQICLREAWCQEMRIWEERCASHTLQQEGVKNFVQLPSSRRSGSLNARYLRNPETILSSCRVFRREVNRRPAAVLDAARNTYEWLAARRVNTSCDEDAYFAGDLALTISCTLRHLGEHAESTKWADTARDWFRRMRNPGPWNCRLELACLALLYDGFRYREVLDRLPPLLTELRRFGLVEDLHRCEMLEAATLKSLERYEESAERLEGMRKDPALSADPLLFGLTLTHLAEVKASVGDHSASYQLFSEASSYLEESATPWALAYLRAAAGEVLRDSGRFLEAADAYRSAAVAASNLGMERWALYYGLLLAETLLLAGREADATEIIVAVSPILERAQLQRGAFAAIALLSESIRRQKADPEALRALRQQIQKMGEVEQ
jgi:tetratricopeptide (TPR) repeat protein